jgi:predicted secreted protein
VGTSLIWSIHVAKPGKYRVELNYSLVDSCEGSKVAISVGDQTVKAKPKPTKAWTDYKTGNAGEVTISKSGDLPVVIKPISKPYGYVMNLRSVALRPVETPTDAIDISDSLIAQEPDGTLELNATNAEIDGQAGRLEGGEKKYLVWWSSPDASIKWPVKLHKPGTFRVEWTYSLAKSSYSRQIEVTEGGKKFTTEPETITSDSSGVELVVGDKSLAATLKAGSGWDDYKTESLGEMIIKNPGELEVVLKSPKALGALVMHLRSISLVPVGKE